MKVLEHPLFFIFAFTLLICIAGIWWLLRGQRERADRQQWTSPLHEDERSVMEILQDVPSATIPWVQHGPVSASPAEPDIKDAAQQIIRREETKTRLAVLDELIGTQRSRIASARTLGLDVTLLEEQLKVLTDSREEYFSALMRLLSEFVDGRNVDGGIP